MRSIPIIILTVVLSFASSAYGAASLAAPVEVVDQFSVGDIEIDATAPSHRAARDLAIVQGLRSAWSILFRGFTGQSAWGKEPRLADDQLLGLILSTELSNERRSTTRYLADVVFHFNPAAVRRVLLKSNITFTKAPIEPSLVIPLIAGEVGFDPMSPWTIAWANPSLQQSLFLVIFNGDPIDLPMPQDLGGLDWAALAPMAQRYDAKQVIFAITSEDAKTVDLIEFSANGKSSSSLAFVQSTFQDNAKAIAEMTASEWRQSAYRKSVAY